MAVLGTAYITTWVRGILIGIEREAAEGEQACLGTTQ